MSNLELYEPAPPGSISPVISRNRADLRRCAVGVWTPMGRTSHYGQCSKLAKHDAVIGGQEVRVCSIHSPNAVAKREAAKQERYERERRKSDYRWQRPADYKAALIEIANGHNDPRTLARETLAAWDDLPSAPDGSPEGRDRNGLDGEAATAG